MSQTPRAMFGSMARPRRKKETSGLPQERHTALWIDMTVSVRETESIKAFDTLFSIRYCSASSSIESEISRVRPAAIFLNFDFPTKQGLKTLQEIKRTYTMLPLVMLTVQHSEALAVWAFRSRVWDYLVKPIAAQELDRCLCCLSEMLSMRSLQAAPRKAAIPASLIPEENRISGPRGQMPLTLAPAISYVEDNYRGKLSSAKAASLCNLTSFQFSRLFKETYGLTFREYVLRFRVREACRLLKHPHAQVADVAHLVGFNDPSYFGKIFRRYTQFSPSRFSDANDSTLDPERLLSVLNAD
jgi:AraC-like DNA-binding protein